MLTVATAVDKKTGFTNELWNYTNYSIKYVLPKGITNGSKNPTKYKYSTEENVYKINNPIKLGYDFMHWQYENKQGNIEKKLSN